MEDVDHGPRVGWTVHAREYARRVPRVSHGVAGTLPVGGQLGKRVTA